jgi:hypothetical protein
MPIEPLTQQQSWVRGKGLFPLSKLCWVRRKEVTLLPGILQQFEIYTFGILTPIPIWDFDANPNLGFIHSGLFHSGKVRGTNFVTFTI